MPAKSKISPYLLFMQDMRRQEPEWANKSNQELMTLVSPRWLGLSQARKDQYTRRAKEMRGLEPGPVTASLGSGAMDSIGRPLVEIKARDEERERTKQRKIKDMDDLIKQLVENDNLEDFEFNVMHTNIFAKTLPEGGEEATYIPAEVSISKFSLRAGLIATYHSFPEGRKTLPMGSKYQCVQQSDALKIPLAAEEGFTVADDSAIVPGIRKFFGDTKICFLMPEFEEQCKGVLEEIAKRSCQPPFCLSYLSLPSLMYRLSTAKYQNRQEEQSICATENIALSKLESYTFLYREGLACDWHEKNHTDKCCQSLVARWIFTILDLCCPLYNIEMVPGLHAPTDPEPVKAVLWKGGNSARRTGGSAISETENGWYGGKDIRYKDSTASIATADSYQQYVESSECADSCSVTTAESSHQDVESLAERLWGIRRDSQLSQASSRASLGRGMLLQRRSSTAVKKPGVI